MDMFDLVESEVSPIVSVNGRYGTLGPRGFVVSPSPSFGEEVRKNPDAAYANRVSRAKTFRRLARRTKNPEQKQRLLRNAEEADAEAKKIEAYADSLSLHHIR